MKKMLFIDRDGTIIKEPTDNFQGTGRKNWSLCRE